MHAEAPRRRDRAAIATPWSTRATLALLGIALGGCAVRPPPAAPMPWRDALQACGMAADDLAAPWPAHGADFCRQAGALGRQLDCLARELPASVSAQAHFSSAGLLAFQACIEPLAGGLLAGRAGRGEDMDLALRHCVLQLDQAPAGPRAPPPWWQVLRHGAPPIPSGEGPADAAATAAPAAPTPASAAPAPTLAAGRAVAPAGLRLRASTGLSWPVCAETAATKPPAAAGSTPARGSGRAASAADHAPSDHPRTP